MMGKVYISERKEKIKMETDYKRTDELLDDLKRVVEDLVGKSREFNSQDEIDSFNEELELQLNNVESLI